MWVKRENDEVLAKLALHMDEQHFLINSASHDGHSSRH